MRRARRRRRGGTAAGRRRAAASGRRALASVLVAELSHAGAYHGDVEPVGGGRDVGGLHGAARLDDRAGPRRTGLFYPVGEGKESVGGERGARGGGAPPGRPVGGAETS